MANGTATPPPGSYQQTSRNIQFTPDGGGGGTLTANCQKVDGSWVQSTLKYDVANCNGVLTYGRCS
jgi:hypothetical protein